MKNNRGNLEDYPDILEAKDLAEYLNIGPRKALDLCHEKDFPAKRIGKCYKISKAGLQRWLDKNVGKLG